MDTSIFLNRFRQGTVRSRDSWPIGTAEGICGRWQHGASFSINTWTLSFSSRTRLGCWARLSGTWSIAWDKQNNEYRIPAFGADPGPHRGDGVARVAAQDGL